MNGRLCLFPDISINGFSGEPTPSAAQNKKVFVDPPLGQDAEAVGLISVAAKKWKLRHSKSKRTKPVFCNTMRAIKPGITLRYRGHSRRGSVMRRNSHSKPERCTKCGACGFVPA